MGIDEPVGQLFHNSIKKGQIHRKSGALLLNMSGIVDTLIQSTYIPIVQVWILIAQLGVMELDTLDDRLYMSDSFFLIGQPSDKKCHCVCRQGICANPLNLAEIPIAEVGRVVSLSS